MKNAMLLALLLLVCKLSEAAYPFPMPDEGMEGDNMKGEAMNYGGANYPPNYGGMKGEGDGANYPPNYGGMKGEGMNNGGVNYYPPNYGGMKGEGDGANYPPYDYGMKGEAMNDGAANYPHYNYGMKGQYGQHAAPEITEVLKDSVNHVSDMYNVMVHVGAPVGEQKVEINYFQGEQKGIAEMIKDNPEYMEKVKEYLEDWKMLKQAVYKLTMMIKQQAQQLYALKAKLNATTGQPGYNTVSAAQVAFSVSLLASGEGHVGPYETHTPLIFKYVLTNIGNAYNPDTGIFTAQVKGGYHFEFYFGASGDVSTGAAAVLVKNGNNTFAAYEHQSSGFGTAANAATLLLEVGDEVCVQLWQRSKVFDNMNHHTTFSGHLLFTMA